MGVREDLKVIAKHLRYQFMISVYYLQNAVYAVPFNGKHYSDPLK